MVAIVVSRDEKFLYSNELILTNIVGKPFEYIPRNKVSAQSKGLSLILLNNRIRFYMFNFNLINEMKVVLLAKLCSYCCSVLALKMIKNC